MVAADGGICSTKGHIRRYFVISKGSKATGVRKVWQDGEVDGLGKS